VLYQVGFLFERACVSVDICICFECIVFLLQVDRTLNEIPVKLKIEERIVTTSSCNCFAGECYHVYVEALAPVALHIFREIARVLVFYAWGNVVFSSSDCTVA
jgi:hypothetical protein